MTDPLPIAELEVRASRTISGHNQAKDKWNEFANLQNYPIFRILTGIDVCGEVLNNGSLANANDPPIRKMMAEFATHLLNRKLLNGNYHRPGAVVQFFSTFKAVLFKRFKPLGYVGPSPDWYTELLHGLEMRATNAAMARGEKVKNKTMGIPRSVLFDCAQYLLSLNTAQAIEERAVIVNLYAACGRSGEVTTQTWDHMTYDPERYAFVNYWGDTKNGQQSEMTYVPDAENFALDVGHALACNLVTGGFGNHRASATTAECGTNWIFPGYVDMTDGGAASKVTRILAKCKAGGVKGIPDNASSHGIRVSATNTMMFHEGLPLPSVIARGGWEHDRESMIFYYFTQKLFVTKGGKVLANWKYPNQPVSAATIDSFQTVENQTLVEDFGDELFSMAPIASLLQTEL